MNATCVADYPDIWLVVCECGHNWVWDRTGEDDRDREYPWGCAGCGAAPPDDLEASVLDDFKKDDI